MLYVALFPLHGCLLCEYFFLRLGSFVLSVWSKIGVVIIFMVAIWLMSALCGSSVHVGAALLDLGMVAVWWRGVVLARVYTVSIVKVNN